MRVLIALVLLVAIVFGAGFYLGWFHIGTESGQEQSKVTLTVDKQKIEQDKDKAIEKAHDLQQRGQAQAAAALDRTSHPATQPAPR